MADHRASPAPAAAHRRARSASATSIGHEAHLRAGRALAEQAVVGRHHHRHHRVATQRGMVGHEHHRIAVGRHLHRPRHDAL